MSRKIKFVTLFPECKNIELIKDVGAIPYTLQTEFGLNCSIVSFKNEENYSFHQQYIPDIEMTFLEPTKHSLLRIIKVIKYLVKYSKNIDILNVYHFGAKDSLLYAYVYKLINDQGKVYLKLDIDELWAEKIANQGIAKKTITKIFLGKIDIVSAESRSICAQMSKVLKRKVEYIPNGVFKFDCNSISTKKENIILCVGRLGTYQKNVELLVKSYVELGINSWSLVLVGERTIEFEKYMEDIYKNTPTTKERIRCLGVINNRDEINELFGKAKIFVLPSRWESFGLVLVEALMKRCYVISSNKVPAAYDLLDPHCGTIFTSESEKDLMLKMQAVINQKTYDNFSWGKEKDYVWTSICADLMCLLCDGGQNEC